VDLTRATGLRPLHTERLRMVAMDGRGLKAWLDRDLGALREATGAWFREPLDAPPLFRDDLDFFSSRLAAAPDEIGWWVWLASLRDGGEAVGVCGLGGPPDADGAVTLGYSVYPHVEGRGYATEAAGALVAWAMEQPGVHMVRATVPLGHVASIRVALKLGMVDVGRAVDPEAGAVTVFERARDV
jgi:ribosomal-protein-alanine N-acetyltransferase